MRRMFSPWRSQYIASFRSPKKKRKESIFTLALKADEDPDRLSFLHAVRVVQRRMARYGAIPPSKEESPA